VRSARLTFCSRTKLDSPLATFHSRSPPANLIHPSPEQDDRPCSYSAAAAIAATRHCYSECPTSFAAAATPAAGAEAWPTTASALAAIADHNWHRRPFLRGSRHQAIPIQIPNLLVAPPEGAAPFLRIRRPPSFSRVRRAASAMLMSSDCPLFASSFRSIITGILQGFCYRCTAVQFVLVSRPFSSLCFVRS